ncbi:hypothetical protein SUGI_0650560 [Cryptomeria japonica]|nr:hypothetical protein SUGI_0650560 [Cryptomeria japonica]
MTRLIFEDKGKVVDIAHTVFCTSLNLLGNMIFGTSVFDPHNPASAELIDNVWEILKLGGIPNLVDFFSVSPKRLDTTSQSIERNHFEKDFLDVLLGFRSEDFTLSGIRALITELFLAGTKTSTTKIEWVMAEFIHNPNKLSKVREELDEVVGCKQRVEESDLDRLPYLHAAVKEVFRMHPASPLLLPRKAGSSFEIDGFVIPKDSEVMVNVWAIGRDPSIWKNPVEFMPERFFEGESKKIEYNGQNFELIPFGAGRRIFPGLPLASRMIHSVLASLLHSFEWILPDGMSCEEMSMSDEFGLALKKATDLQTITIPRLPHHIY